MLAPSIREEDRAESCHLGKGGRTSEVCRGVLGYALFRQDSSNDRLKRCPLLLLWVDQVRAGINDHDHDIADWEVATVMDGVVHIPDALFLMRHRAQSHGSGHGHAPLLLVLNATFLLRSP